MAALDDALRFLLGMPHCSLAVKLGQTAFVIIMSAHDTITTAFKETVRLRSI